MTVLLCVCGDELRITKLQFLGKSALKQNVSKRIVRMRKIFKSECLERQTKDNKKKLKPVNNEYRYNACQHNCTFHCMRDKVSGMLEHLATASLRMG